MNRKTRRNSGIALIAIGIIALFYLSTLQSLYSHPAYDIVEKYGITSGIQAQMVLNGHTYLVSATPSGTSARITVYTSWTGLDVTTTYWPSPVCSGYQHNSPTNLKTDASVRMLAECCLQGGVTLDCDVGIWELKSTIPEYLKCTEDLVVKCTPAGYTTECGERINKCISGVYQGIDEFCKVTSACSNPVTCSNPTGYENEIKCADGGVEIKCNSGGFWVPTGGTCGSENPPPPVPETCGNNVIDTGEDCINCPADIEAVMGKDYCSAECDIFCQLGNSLWYIIIGIGVVVLLTAGLWPKKR